ncbi:cytochrome c [Gammaproteobacteria bacterium AB-CW1]|uniref:Cytochrome c n=1 Tax=Natronospira elongata TaxID=3110268 RepID=A0AAP6JF09_9GAMM|nr:cytochrome c [Gammaproteobacteria bacterium AB-CW1]
MNARKLALLSLPLAFIPIACEGPAGDAEEREARIMASAYPEGAALYERQCRACHQSDGQGLAGTFPPLAGHAPELVQAEGGREYFIRVILWGLGGEIEIRGERYGGVMPGFARLSDENVAAIINHSIHAWGGEDALPQDFQSIKPEEVSELREPRMTPRQVRETRPEF